MPYIEGVKGMTLNTSTMKTITFLSIAAAAVVGAMTSVDLAKKGDGNAAALFAGFTAFAAASSVCTIGSIIDEA